MESGYDYRGARFYDSEVGRFLSVDPLAAEAPQESTYSAVGNNPIFYVDPDGQFKIPVHKRIIENAFNNSSLSAGYPFRSDVSIGATIKADIAGFFSDFHFDGRQNYSEVQDTWNSLNTKIDAITGDIGFGNKTFGGSDALNLGTALHTVQDFYSHSNYVELYIEYYQAEYDGAMPTSVPVYNAGTKNSKFKAILTDRLRTGDFDLYDNEFTNPNGERAQESTSHNKMNKDYANTIAGELAEKVATKHTTEILNKIK